jgi:hypothetical protein
MYGNVDASLRFFKTYILVHPTGPTMEMKQSLADPCVFYKRNKTAGQTVLIAVCFVDNTLLVGTKKFVDNTLLVGTKKEVKWFDTLLVVGTKI